MTIFGELTMPNQMMKQRQQRELGSGAWFRWEGRGRRAPLCITIKTTGTPTIRRWRKRGQSHETHKKMMGERVPGSRYAQVPEGLGHRTGEGRSGVHNGGHRPLRVSANQIRASRRMTRAPASGRAGSAAGRGQVFGNGSAAFASEGWKKRRHAAVSDAALERLLAQQVTMRAWLRERGRGRDQQVASREKLHRTPP